MKSSNIASLAMHCNPAKLKSHGIDTGIHWPMEENRKYRSIPNLHMEI